MLRTYDAAQLATRVREKRAEHKLTIRQAAQEAGVSTATISRVMRGNHLPDYDTLLLLTHWLGISVEDLTVASEASGHSKPSRHAVVHSPDETTPEAVALVLHADTSLAAEDVDMFMEVFRAMYDRVRKRNDEQSKSEVKCSI
jgi:transcriptional regulator with XRE-family HTH domain